MFVDPKILKNAEQALVQLGQQPRAQAEAYAAKLTPAELLAAHSCHQEGDKLRLVHLLEHVATRQHLEADLNGYLNNPRPEASPDDPTVAEEPTV